MELIYDILKRLKKQEIRHIKHIFKTSSFSYDKVGKLFDLVTGYGEKEEAFFSKKLYKKEPENTFRVTKSRLKRMMENVLLQDKSLTSNASAAVNAGELARKKLLQGRILLGRGATLAGKNILSQVINTSKKYNLHSEGFEAELLLYRNLSTRISVREHQKQTQRILDLNRKRALVDEAVILHYAVTNMLSNKTLKKASVEAMRQQIDRMGVIAGETDHPLTENYYYLAEIYFHQAIHNPKDARNYCEAYLGLLDREQTLYTPSRMGGAYIQLAQINIELGDLDAAQLNIEKSLEAFDPNSINHLLVLEVAFRVAFLRKKWQQASLLIDEASVHPYLQESQNLQARWRFREACLLFRQGEFKAAYMALNDTSPLLSDTFGVNIAVRMLDIMIMYEMNKLDLLESKILNMRQFIKRTQKDMAQQRAAILVRLLLGWYKNNYNFNDTLELHKELIHTQSQEEDGPGWRPTTYELIPFDEWFEEKATAY
jgi:tetratricopeptide (TPR) repeat protein